MQPLPEPAVLGGRNALVFFKPPRQRDGAAVADPACGVLDRNVGGKQLLYIVDPPAVYGVEQADAAGLLINGGQVLGVDADLVRQESDV